MNNKLARYILIGVGTAVVLFIAWYFSNIVTYILISAVLSIVVKPLVDKLNKIHIGKLRMSRALSATIGLMVIWVTAFLFFYFFIPLIADQMKILSNVNYRELGSHLTEPLAKLEELIQMYIPGAQAFSFNEIVTDSINSFFKEQDVTAIFGSVANMVKSLAIGLFSIAFITFFFLKEENLFSGGVIVLFPKKYEQNIARALSSATNLLIRYFVGVLLDMICIMVLLTIGLTLVAGLPFSTAIVIGLVAGILNVIPYVGPLIGAVFGLVVGGAVHIESLTTDVAMIMTGKTMITSVLLRIAVVFVVMKIIDDAVFQPYIFSSSVKAHPLEIFLVLLVAGSIAGIFGMLIAIPAYTVLRVFAKEFFYNFRVVQKLTEKI